ncbi:hypothetical protein SAMN05660284_00620 [Formivibrio citricus]|uniref:Circularly permuted type 2 ATP-grasp protein n=1 Tax=Formivibrio citricus TaxID=83765 RepID=A0A1I4WID2_9NEIS|nr:hypothetical protein [Formivibrio citricus]SFN13155.1 hypothetical protein SAMN05660284_00620 [Formivibrio citricus]
MLVTPDFAALQSRLEARLFSAGLDAPLSITRPNLFAPSALQLSRRGIDRMCDYIAAVEAVVALPAWQEQALARAPAIARHQPAARGVFYGFDFHLGEQGPQVIEINTNAGGAMLNLLLAQAMRACSPNALAPTDLDAQESDFIAMFHAEWQAERGDLPLRRIAIVDEAPAGQFLAPEFELFRQLFLRHGIEAVIAAPEELTWDGAQLLHDGQPVDLVYNRLTDFYLAAPELAAIRAAYLQDGVVLTPHPRAHALYADKRNLLTLCDAAQLAALGADQQIIRTLVSGTPPTRLVTPEDAEALWAERRQWFFKPNAGYGSKAAYRGDKLTKRVWEEIQQGGYVAQRLVPPGECEQAIGGEPQRFKVDIRVYSYAGKAQLFAARLYQGQTTNFRTPGGGFAPVWLDV